MNLDEILDFYCEKHGKTISIIKDGKKVCALCVFEELTGEEG